MQEPIKLPPMIKKQFIGKTETDDDARTLTATISTGIVDRENEVLLPKGINFEQYLKNPVVLWAHEYREQPIAKAMWITKSPKYIKAKVKFADTVKAEEIYQLFKGGFLNAFSVGFLPAENGHHPPTPDEVKKHPEWAEAKRIYDNWELLEFSAVPVPANPEALVLAVKELKISPKTQEELGVEEVWIVPDEDNEWMNACLGTRKQSDDTSTNTGDSADDDIIGKSVNKKGIFIYKNDDGESCEIAQWGIDKQGWILTGALGPILKPEETEKYIRIPVRSCEITATITISASQGIKGLYCGKVKKVATYLFAKAKGWTMAKAKAWVKEHDGKSTNIIETSPVIMTAPYIVTEPIRQALLNPRKEAAELLLRIKGKMY